MADVGGIDATGDAEIFVYTGEGGQVVPRDVIRCRVHPSVTTIPEEAFIIEEIGGD